VLVLPAVHLPPAPTQGGVLHGLLLVLHGLVRRERHGRLLLLLLLMLLVLLLLVLLHGGGLLNQRCGCLVRQSRLLMLVLLDGAGQGGGAAVGGGEEGRKCGIAGGGHVVRAWGAFVYVVVWSICVTWAHGRRGFGGGAGRERSIQFRSFQRFTNNRACMDFSLHVSQSALCLYRGALLTQIHPAVSHVQGFMVDECRESKTKDFNGTISTLFEFVGLRGALS
jgi:hypothetical protein